MEVEGKFLRLGNATTHPLFFLKGLITKKGNLTQTEELGKSSLFLTNKLQNKSLRGPLRPLATSSFSWQGNLDGGRTSQKAFAQKGGPQLCKPLLWTPPHVWFGLPQAEALS